MRLLPATERLSNTCRRWHGRLALNHDYLVLACSVAFSVPTWDVRQLTRQDRRRRLLGLHDRCATSQRARRASSSSEPWRAHGPSHASQPNLAQWAWKCGQPCGPPSYPRLPWAFPRGGQVKPSLGLESAGQTRPAPGINWANLCWLPGLCTAARTCAHRSWGRVGKIEAWTGGDWTRSDER